MSDLSRLKSQLHAIASDANRMSGQLASFESKFARSISEVQQRIGGSSVGADRQIIEILQGATKAVRSASDSLTGTARAAQRYADSL